MKVAASSKFLVPAFLILSAWLLLAAEYHCERLYGDSAYYLFQLVNEGKFVIEHLRPVSVVMQVIPYILVQDLAPLDEIILWFSLNEWLYYFGCFLVLFFWLKEPALAAGFLFALIIGSRWNFFNHVSELVLAVPLFFIWFSLARSGLDYRKLAVSVILIAIVVFSHPLYMLLVLFAVFMIPKEVFSKNRTPYFIMLAMIGVVILAKYLSLTGYEADSVSGNNRDLASIFNTLKTYNYARFIFSVGPAYLGMLIMLGFIIYHRRKLDSRFQYYWFILFIIGYFVLVLYKYGHHFPQSYEPFERYLMILPIAVTLIFFSYTVVHINKKLLNVLLVCLALYHIGALALRAEKVRDRYHHFYRVLDYASRQPQNKISFRGENFFTRRYGSDYFMSNESLLLSARPGRMNTRQVFVREAIDDRIYNEVKNGAFLYAAWWDKKLPELNTNYFYFENNTLLEANTDSLQMDLPDSVLSEVDVSFVNLSDYKFDKSETYYPLIKIKNRMKAPLFSGMHKDGIRLTVAWRLEGHDLLLISDCQSPIMADVYNELTQEICLKIPGTSGKYELSIGLTFSNGRFIPLNQKSVKVDVSD